jgi:hypothetical protein
MFRLKYIFVGVYKHFPSRWSNFATKPFGKIMERPNVSRIVIRHALRGMEIAKSIGNDERTIVKRTPFV